MACVPRQQREFRIREALAVQRLTPPSAVLSTLELKSYLFVNR